MTRNDVHQYVLEHTTGSIKARRASTQTLWVVFGVSFVAAVIILLSNTDDSSTVGLAICTVIAGVPLGVIAQRTTLRIALSRDSLRLKRFLIGKKGYVAPKDHVLHEQADLFAIAANLVCKEPFLAPQSNAAAWHTFSVLADTPGVAVYEGWYGKNTQASLFLYGDVRMLTEITSDVWDLGHVRTLAESDKERFLETSKGWKRQQLIPLGLAYAPLPSSADPTNLKSVDIQNNCVLLGAVGLEGTRGYGQDMPISPAVSIAKATALQAVISTSLALFALASTLANRWFSIAPPANMLLILTVGVFIAPLLLAVLSWDHASKANKSNLGDHIWNSALIAGISYAIYLIYLYWQSALNAPISSLAHQTGSAIAVLTFGLSLLVYVGLSRFKGKWKPSLKTANPLYLLAWASSLLIIVIISYGSGPLLLGGIVMAIGAAAAFGTIYQLRAYAEHHHSREHIIELLRS